MRKFGRVPSFILIVVFIIAGISIYTEKVNFNNKIVGTWSIQNSGYNSDKYTEEEMKGMISNGGIFQGLMLMRNSMIYSKGTLVTFEKNNNLNMGLINGSYKINDKHIEIDLGDGNIDSFEINIADGRLILYGDYVIELIKK